MSKPLIIGIDASRNRSGGAVAHMQGILGHGDPLRNGIQEINLWAYQSLLDAIPDRPWLTKHNPAQLQQSLTKQLWWQAARLSQEVVKNRCNVLFTAGASTLCRFKPMIVLSQDMLSYEPGIMKQFGFTRARLRLLAILLLQNRAFKLAQGVIFLSRYAAEVIQKSSGPLPHVTHIPHGIGEDFRTQEKRPWPKPDERPLRCIYVSPTWLFKHQWVVVRAIAALRKRGYNLTIEFIGGGSVDAQRLLAAEIAALDPEGVFVTQKVHVPHGELPSLLASSDIFIFASSCENMPVTLVEAMAVGLPIACSDRGPMPEVLADGGVYFDPLEADSIAQAVESIIEDPELREKISQRSRCLSEQYSWSRCANETWEFIAKTCADSEL